MGADWFGAASAVYYAYQQVPHTKVAIELAGDDARIRKAGHDAGESVRGRLALEALRGTADLRMTTDEIMALTRGEGRPRKRRK
ncbi:MAG: hypothetical protein ABSF98_25785 [Bryobacteraceae bacterium]